MKTTKINQSDNRIKSVKAGKKSCFSTKNLTNFNFLNFINYILKNLKPKNILNQPKSPIFLPENTSLALLNQPKSFLSIFWQSFNQIANITQ